MDDISELILIKVEAFDMSLFFMAWPPSHGYLRVFQLVRATI